MLQADCRRLPGIVFGLAIALAPAVPLPVASQDLPVTQTDSTFRLAGARAETPPQIDGAIGAEEWASAAVAGDFIQYEPRWGELSAFRTEALVMHDDQHIYIAFRAFDPSPPAAQLTRRDADLVNDDAVIVLLDTHNDRRSGYYFLTNALGTQTDGRIADDGRTVDDTWDASWLSAAQRTDFGWTAELSIPLRSMQYRAGTDRTWGLNLGRSRPRNLELSFWAGPLETTGRVSQAGFLTGLDLPAPERPLQAIVYGLTRVQAGASDEVDGGADIRLAVTPQISMHGTLNPDFATIEADQERINLTRFELSLPEKRPFFLESAELFRQRIRTFYSRRIPDIIGGVQTRAKVGPWTIAAVGTRAEAFEATPGATYGVARLQRDVGASSNIALTYADRFADSDHQGSLGMDATLFFTPTFGMTAQAIKSWGPTEGGTWGYFIRPAYDSPTRHFHVRYTHLGDAFGDNVNAVGFVRDDDRRELDGAFEQTIWFRGATLDRLRYDSNYNIYWSQQEVLRSWEVVQSLGLDFSNRLSSSVRHVEEFKRFESDFRNRQTRIEIGYNTREFESVRSGLSFGRNFDSNFLLWTVGTGVKVTDGLSVEYDLQRLTLDPDPDEESTWIHVVRADQFFTPDLFLRVFFQTNSRIERENVQAVFVYRYKPPFGTIQLAFQRGTAEFGERSEQGNTLFLKATMVF
jgi:hypothetical protein